MPIQLDGPVTVGTKRNLIAGVRSSSMPEAAVDAVFQQISRFTDRLVNIYSSDIAAGEVGADGTGRATDAPIIGDQPPRTLLYGRIQSGKTVSMVLTAALCLDNGFRVIVVLTTDNVALVRQTAGRFKDLDGPRVFAGVKDGPSYEWQGQEQELREAVASEGIVLVCAKNTFNLPEVIRFLSQLDASNYPVLVLDDEADAATPDTTLAARAAARPNAPDFSSKMHRLVIANDAPGEEGFSLGEELPHSLYVQVTATPYVLFLQREASAMRPTETFLLEPGEGYCGGEEFFGNFDPDVADAEQPTTIVLVGMNESAMMRRAAPAGLARSINFFILSALAAASARGWPAKGYKHLSHTSFKMDEHELVAMYITAHLNEIRRTLALGADAVAEFFAEAYAELGRSLNPRPPVSDILAAVPSALRNADVFRINSQQEAPEYGPRLNFLVGGNILGRGLTIDDLLVTYYVREAKQSQMDTVWQHARMFGYRRSILNYMRVYLPRPVAVRFQQIHVAEEALRQTLAADGDAAAVLIRVPSASRPTRPNALEAGAIRAVPAGRIQVHPHLMKVDASAAQTVLELLTNNGVVVDEAVPRADRPRLIPMEAGLELVDAVVTAEDDPGLWSPEVIRALFHSFEQQLQGGCIVYVREVEEAQPPAQGWWRGRLGGPDVAAMRNASAGAPALAFLYYKEDDRIVAWYPTLVMPTDSPTFVFSGE